MEEWSSIVHVKWAVRALIPKEGASKTRKPGDRLQLDLIANQIRRLCVSHLLE